MPIAPKTLEHKILDFLFTLEKPKSIAVDTRGIFTAKYPRESGEVLEITIGMRKVLHGR